VSQAEMRERTGKIAGWGQTYTRPQLLKQYSKNGYNSEELVNTFHKRKREKRIKNTTRRVKRYLIRQGERGRRCGQVSVYPCEWEGKKTEGRSRMYLNRGAKNR